MARRGGEQRHSAQNDTAPTTPRGSACYSATHADRMTTTGRADVRAFGASCRWRCRGPRRERVSTAGALRLQRYALELGAGPTRAPRLLSFEGSAVPRWSAVARLDRVERDVPLLVR